MSLSKEVHQVSSNITADFSQQIRNEYSDLFSDELGKLPVTYSMTFDPKVRPVVRPAHRILVAMKDRVKAELDRMQELGVITLRTYRLGILHGCHQQKRQTGDQNMHQMQKTSTLL